MQQSIGSSVVQGGTRALLEFSNMHSRVRRAKSETHFYDLNWEKVSG